MTQNCSWAWWGAGKGCPVSLGPYHLGQGVDAHTSWANDGRLTQPQRSEPHLDSWPKIRDSSPCSELPGQGLYSIDRIEVCYLITLVSQFSFSKKQ